MLTLSIGQDPERVLERMRSVIATFREERPNAPLVRLDAPEATPDALREFAASVSLLGEPSLVVVRGPLEDAGTLGGVLELAPALAESPNRFYIADEALSAGEVKAFEKAGAEVDDAGGSSPAEERRFTAFPLADAVLGRDRAKAWALFLECGSAGMAVEEIHGALVWQVKNVLLVMQSTENPGLAPFVYSKAKRFGGLWKKEELESFLEELVYLYHEAHRGASDFGTGLEKLLLERL